MPTTLYLAPSGNGKTSYLVDRAREFARDPTTTPRVIVPTRLQARAWRQRLARAGGALGIRVGPFDDIYREILHTSGSAVTQLVDPVQVRLLRTVIDASPLSHYAAIRTMPGFVQAVRDLIGELKAGGVFPEALIEAVESMDSPPRLMELAQLYESYQLRLQEEDWADYAGVGWLAAETLAQHPTITTDWPCVMVDGFDDLTTVQIQVLTALADRVQSLIITLTGTLDGKPRELAHKRFNRTRERLEAALGVTAEPLPSPGGSRTTASLRHLEATLYTDRRDTVPAAPAVTLVAAPDREAEVRSALRWLKSRIVHDGFRPSEVALVMRDMEPYRAFIDQTAAEYGLPVRNVAGHALRTNPAITALLDLLQLATPGEAHLAWRPTVAAWRSPYFDWAHAHAATDDAEPIGITGGDADALAWVARWGSVIGGFEQWAESFDLLREFETSSESRDEDAQDAPAAVPTGAEAEALSQKFQRFCTRIAPPEGERSYRDFVAWLEGLIGDGEDTDDEHPTTLGVARQAADGDAALVERDLAALETLKDVLRGLVWAEQAVTCPPLTYTAFLDELTGAIDAATYQIPLPTDAEAILAADVTQVRGISYRAVAVMGLAEGEFPTTLSEDPFLRNADRMRLHEEFGLEIDGSPENLEAQHFYSAVTRPREALLMTRPRIADNGAPWQPSPFWEEVRRRLDIVPQELTSLSRPAPAEAASWPELLESVAASSNAEKAWAWIQKQQPAICERITHGEGILGQRNGQGPADGDGDLTSWATTFTERFHPRRPWSASRLESYRRCPFFFFVGSVLGLEPRQAPTEGLDARQLGNIYHHIFEMLYRTAGVDPELDTLLELLPDVAAPILDAAPRTEQFRATAWWAVTREEIVENVRQSVEAIEALDDDFAFYQAERTFGISGAEGPALVVQDGGGDEFRLRGFIDRVDRDPAGRIRVVDYKTAGSSGYTDSAVRDGKKLQLPLYALAAQDALKLGDVVEGFYWHVQHQEASGFKLSGFRGDEGRGPEAAMDAVKTLAWEAVRGARSGHFVPSTPDGGCPDYCAAAAFCWHYEAGFGGRY